MVKWVVLFLCLTTAPAHATEVARIAIIIDDLGDQWRAGSRAINLPGSMTYAFLPHTPHAVELANKAHDQGKEVMLHLPMQSMDAKSLGPGGLTLDMSKALFVRAVRDDISAIPHVRGINNHMGSLLTRHPGHMQWLMEEINHHGDLFFIDSRTTHHTVAEQVARENHVPVQRRDVFLDDDPSPEAIAFQFHRLLKKARHEGMAIGIGHPYDTTLSLLEQVLPQLEEKGIKLVHASELFQSPPPPSPEIRMADSPQIDKHLVYLDEPPQPPTSPAEQETQPQLGTKHETGTQPAI
ncbi:MAG TPA: divergent polysaccharide deacetylase family protein [Candidatus Tenderia sp.]|nr:divergent polysaccharide deacetylase family protein [Candidatus Tenderia sp.]